MRLRDKIESVLRAWNAYEAGRNGPAVIDYDCRPTDEEIVPATSRLEVYRRLRDLRQTTVDDDTLSTPIDAHLTYLRAVLGERPDLAEYVKVTQGCAAAGWSEAYVSECGELAREHLDNLGITWDTNTDTELREREGILAPDATAESIRQAASELESLVRKATGTTAPYSLTVEMAAVDAYWSYWLDSVGQDVRLRLNSRGARFTKVKARQFALHEVLGHGLQSASLAARCQQEDVGWVRLISVHTPYQVMFEGLAQALPLFVTPDDLEVIARVRLDHYLQLVRAELHLAINTGHSIETCAQHARARVPWWSDETIADELCDRGTNPLLRSYLWSYAAGLDWFVALADDADRADIGKVLHAAYRDPLTPADLAVLWPAGPPIGGTGGPLRLRDPALS
jgi:hypothetical protein